MLKTCLRLAVFVAATAPLHADTYSRQSGVDIARYVFKLSLQDGSDEIAAEARIDGERTTALPPAQALVLDLVKQSAARAGKGMAVRAVEVNGALAAFSHEQDRLSVPLPPGAPHTRFSVLVRYHGVPAEALRIGPNRYGERTFFSSNWPDLARNWLPVVDHPYDKAACEFDIEAPAHYQVLASGVLVEETDLDGERRRTRWRQDVPIAPWLYGMGVARFAVEQLGTVRGTPLSTWVYARDRDHGFGTFAHPTPEAFSFFSENVGPYAYGKLANVQAAGVRGGMELAGNIFYGEDSVAGPRVTERWHDVIVHEIAHQWFGDSVTENDWDDVWLSEGFATYFTLLFNERTYGRDVFLAKLEASRRQVLEFAAANPGYRVIHENLADMTKVLSGQIYQKGAWTLHMLRGVVGDDAFWRGVREYYRRYAGGNATTADFERCLEDASGQELGFMFDQWLRRADIPQVSAGWSYDEAAHQVRLEMTQGAAASDPGAAAFKPLRLPMQVEIRAADGSTRREAVTFDRERQEFTFAAPARPAAVVFDPDNFVLMAAASRTAEAR